MRMFLFVCGTESEAFRHQREFANSTGTHILYTWPGDTRTLAFRPVGYMVTELAHMLASTDPTFAGALAGCVDVLERNIAKTVPSHRYLPSYV